MIKIKEIQKVKDNPKDRQERIIEYSSWEDYCNDVSIIDGIKYMAYPSMPSRTRPYNIHKQQGYVTFEFYHRLLGKTVLYEGVEIVDCPACTAESKSSYMCETCYGRGYVENI